MGPPDAAVVLYRRGPRWQDDRPLGEQEALRDHIAFLVGLGKEGIVEQAGPFHARDSCVGGELVGLAIFRRSAAEVEALVADDPAARAGTMVCEVHAWHR